MTRLIREIEYALNAKFSSLVDGHLLADVLGMRPDELLAAFENHGRIHAALVPSGAFFVHPAGLRSYFGGRTVTVLDTPNFHIKGRR